MEIQELNFRKIFQAKQLEAWDKLFNSRCKYLLYGGAAGGGKSYFLRWAALGLSLYYYQKYKVKGIQIGLFSEDYPTLRDRQLIRIEREFPPEIGQLKDFTDVGLAFKLREDAGGGVIMLRNLDDASKYMSTEFAAEFVDELTKNTENTFEDLRFRLRYPGIDEIKFVGATNPGEIGHGWVKKLWVSPDPNNPDNEQDRFFFVPAKVQDNKFIVLEQYLKQLESMPEQKRKAWLEGSWDIIKGQVFTEWSDSKHVITPFKIPDDWKRYGAIDLGWNKPMSAGWFAVDPNGRSYLYRELYGNADWFARMFSKPMTAKRIAKALIGLSENEKIRYWVGDPAMWNKILLGQKTDTIQGQSYAEIMMKAGLNLIRGDNDRKNGLAKYREVLSVAPDGKPWYQVFNTCYDTIRSIPGLIYDKTQYEDVDTDGEDHCYDRDRYFFMSRPSSTKKERPQKSDLRRFYEQKVNEQQGGDTNAYW